MQGSIVLEMRDVSKRFGATQALSDVDLSLAAGERVAVMGENGAGKSTLMKVIAGVHQPDSGKMELAGSAFAPQTPLAAIDAGIATVYQEPAGFGHLSVLENIVMGRHRTRALGWLDTGNMVQDAAALLDRVGLPARTLRRTMGRLSLAEQQLVLIARAVTTVPKVLILDEPTSILTDTEAQRLFRVVDELAADGTAICYITHRFDELERIADRFVVLRDGRNAGELGEPHRDRLLELMGGRELGRPVSETAPAAADDSQSTEREHGELVLRARGLRLEGTFEEIDLDVHAGSVTGLYGLVGAGRTELALSVLGELPLDGGDLTYLGSPHRPGGVRRALAKGIAYLPEDRKLQGILQHMEVAENISVSALPAASRAGVIRRAVEKGIVRRWIDRVRIKTQSPRALVTSLSGGNQQKVLLARLLATEPRLLILDEPTRGIDVGTKQEIHRDIHALVRAGVAVLLISSEMAELLELSDVVHVLHEGHMTATLAGADLTEAEVLRNATGVMTR